MKRSKGSDWFYFKLYEYPLAVDSNREDLYDSSIYMVIGWQYLEKDGQKNLIYFHREKEKFTQNWKKLNS